jgi:hypothetical protein
MAIIYGVDTTKPYGPVEVRDAIIECFTKAHSQIMEKDMAESVGDMKPKDLEEMKNLNVQLMIKNYFTEVGGDFENPTKESIIAVCDKLAEFSRNFRVEGIIKKHYNEIMALIEKLN